MKSYTKSFLLCMVVVLILFLLDIIFHISSEDKTNIIIGIMFVMMANMYFMEDD